MGGAKLSELRACRYP